MTPLAVLYVLLNMTRFHADRHETPQERSTLLAPVAVAIAEAAHNPTEAAMLAATGKHESDFSRAVIEGRCSELGAHACDSGKARGPFQLHDAACPAAKDLVPGSPESLRVEAECAMQLLRFGAAHCRDHAPTPVHGAVSLYATGKGCSWKGAEARVRTTRKVLSALKAIPDA